MKNRRLYEALVLSVELWEWLRDNPDEDKETWPGWDEDQPGCYQGEEIYSLCFLCDIFMHTTEEKGECPLYLGYSCTNGWHPFSRYMRAMERVDPVTQRREANKIVTIMKQALKEVDND